MTYAAALARGIDKVNIDRRREKAVGIQLAGTKLDEIEKAVKFIEDKVDVFDYNLGCPVSKAQRQKVGAILLEDPPLVKKILSKIVSSTNKPVFAKIRSGYSDKNINYLKIGRIAQDVGCAAVTLHPRTAVTKRGGGANWDHIKKLKSKLDIPVIGNGDINSPEDALQLISTTDCDYVMLGRAAAKNPAIFKQCNDFIRTGKYKETNQLKLANEYIELNKKYNTKFSTIKSHVTYFLKPHAEIINKTKDINTLKKTLKSL
jgi:nifR3 family TIM-barrel protein